MLKYDDVLNDKEIIEIYNYITNVSDNKLWARHGWNHVLKVVDLIENILLKLNYTEDIINCAKIAGLLHDVGCKDGKENHAYIGYKIVEEYFKNKDISVEDASIILNAILNHGNANESDDIITAVLVFADKIDMDKNRLTQLGHTIENFNQAQYIEDVNIDISEDYLKVNFAVNDTNFDIQKLEKYYLIPKIFKGTISFANFIGKKEYITINNEKWELEKLIF